MLLMMPSLMLKRMINFVVLRKSKRDMQASQPMDRLLVGDVGFGKTEVAMRAAFKAVMITNRLSF